MRGSDRTSKNFVNVICVGPSEQIASTIFAEAPIAALRLVPHSFSTKLAAFYSPFVAVAVVVWPQQRRRFD